MSQAWANPSAVKHTPIEQQLYVSKALLLSVNLLDASELQELQSGANKVFSLQSMNKKEEFLFLHWFLFRFTSVYAGRHAEPLGQQFGPYSTYGDGGGRVSELSYGYQWNQTQI